MRRQPSRGTPDGPSAPDDGDGARHAYPANRVLEQLPAPTLDRLASHLHRVTLQRRDVLFRAHEPISSVVFPTTAVVSFVASLRTGETLEVGLVGRDGFAPTSVFPGMVAMTCDGVVQIPGEAYRVDAAVLRRELLHDEPLHAALGHHAELMLARCMQISMCNMFHPAEQRCIRWLLTVHDLTGRDDLPFTHELIATMLGVRRPTVSLVLGALHHAGLVKEARGHIQFLDRPGLEQACCECYRAMRADRPRMWVASHR